MWARVLRFSWGRVIVMLAVVWAILQVLHMTLLSKLEARNAQLQRTRLTKLLHDESLQLYDTMKARIESAQIVDSSGEYKIVNGLFWGEAMQGSNLVAPSVKRLHASLGDTAKVDVTLVTQCSVNLMHHLVALSNHWKGPISVTVFAPDLQAVVAMEVIVKLYQCVVSVRQNLTIHLVYPFVQAPETIPSFTSSRDFSSCINLEEFLDQKVIKNQNYDLGGTKYPNNLLRNVAVSNTQTEYIFVIDIDMLPSGNIHQDFIEFADQHSLMAETHVLDDRTAFVVPAFEVLQGVPPPRDKERLLRLWQEGELRPFYSETCWKCQRWTDYDWWRNLTADSHSKLQIAYELEWKDPWEPFYIGPRTAPRYDERFKQYGFNRISQVSHIFNMKNEILFSILCCLPPVLD